MVAAGERKMSFPSIRDFAREANVNESTVREHLATLVEANVFRRDPISLNREESVWDTSVLEDHVHRKVVARKTAPSHFWRQDLALADLWMTRAIQRLESQLRGSEFLPHEPAMEKEADELQAKVVAKVLVDTRANLEGVLRFLPPLKQAEAMFPLFFFQEDPVVPDIAQVMDWLQEVKTILNATTVPPQVATKWKMPDSRGNPLSLHYPGDPLTPL